MEGNLVQPIESLTETVMAVNIPTRPFTYLNIPVQQCNSLSSGLHTRDRSDSCKKIHVSFLLYAYIPPPSFTWNYGVKRGRRAYSHESAVYVYVSRMYRPRLGCVRRAYSSTGHRVVIEQIKHKDAKINK